VQSDVKKLAHNVIALPLMAASQEPKQRQHGRRNKGGGKTHGKQDLLSSGTAVHQKEEIDDRSGKKSGTE
jgi:hypothetical protein